MTFKCTLAGNNNKRSGIRPELKLVSESRVPAQRTETREKKNSKKNRNDFIEQEANVSADVINSSDESENSSLDQLDESFIDDQTQDNNNPTHKYR